MANCIGVGCKRQSKARNLCMKHLMRLRKHGDIERVDKATTHGKTNTPEYFAWLAIKYRCNNPRSKSYSNYGARGIKMCERWANSFEKFIEDMGPRPSNKYSIDRIDNDGNYEPSNCRWADRRTQASNKRNIKRYEYDGKLLTKVEISEKLGVSARTFYRHAQNGNIKSTIKKFSN